MDKKNITIIGLGGVGGYFGFKINQSNQKNKQHNVSFVVRGETYDIIEKTGLTLLSTEHNVSLTKPDVIYKDTSEISKPDLVIVCVKEYDLENICNKLNKVITSDTVILPMMNGADIYDRIRKIIPNNTILPSCVYVASHIKEKGVVEHKGKSGKLIFGKDPEHISEDINWIIDLMSHSNINFEFKENSMIEIWTKFIFIASFGMVTALHNSSIGEVCNMESQKKEATNIMNEIKSIAIAKGIILDKDIIRQTFIKAATFPPETPTSLQLDINSKKTNNELELFAGAIIKYGKQNNINTDYTESIYLKIKNI
ncbi:MAG: 2-dehydropantoate 2-reductase [Flavobacteriaceae bacterium]|nr:2-dehydropantoate 2-reductase [Flavobacteriaceae bacterium]